MPMTPSEYAARYLPVMVPTDGPDNLVPVKISHYRLPSAAGEREKQSFVDAVNRYRAAQGKNDVLQVYINGEALEITESKEYGRHVYRPFIGKGSPEECQLVLQLAVLTKYKTAAQLQKWADDALGLDCNGFVGNYVFHEWMGNDWDVAPPSDGAKPPKGPNDLNGPSADLDTLFQFASGPHEEHVVTNLDDLSPHDTYLVVRVDSSGSVIPGGSARAGGLPGHLAITEPGQIQRRFMSDSPGNCNRDFAGLNMCDRPALRTVESAGPTNGVGSNWMVVVKPHTRVPRTVLVTRDKADLRIPNAEGDMVKIAPLLCPALLYNPKGGGC